MHPPTKMAGFQAVIAAAPMPNWSLLCVRWFGTSWRYDAWQWWRQTWRNRARRQGFLLDVISHVNWSWRSTLSCGHHEAPLLAFNSLTATGARERQLFYKLHCWWLVTSPFFVRCQRLMARKIDDLFGLNCSIRCFYVACCFDELSRGSVLCLFNNGFKTAVSQRHNYIFWAKIDVRQGNTGQILAQWCCLMAYRVALDLPSWAMCSALYRLIRMAIKMACKGVAFVCHHRFHVLHNPS